MFCAQLMDWEAETSDQGQASPCAAYKGALPWAGTHFFGLFLPFIHSRMCSWKLSPIFRGWFFFFFSLDVQSMPALGRGCQDLGQWERGPQGQLWLMRWWAAPEEACALRGASRLRRSHALRGASRLRRSRALRGSTLRKAQPWGEVVLKQGPALRRSCPLRALNAEVRRCLRWGPAVRWVQPWGGAVLWGGPALRGEGVLRSAQPPWASCCSHEGRGLQEGRALGVVALASLVGLLGSWAVAAGWALQGAG